MKQKHILVVDDDAVNHFIYDKLFTAVDWQDPIQSAYNGHEALQLLKRNCEGLLAIPDLILLDLHMPLMDGLEFLKGFNTLDCLEGKRENVVIAVVSASTNPDDHSMAKSLGARYIITKPISVTNLASLIRTTFN